MPVLTSCEARSPPAVESPPRKKFKLSLKLKTKKKAKANNPMDSDSDDDSGGENGDSVVNSERKEALNSTLTSSLTKSTNSMTDANTTFGLRCGTVNPPLPYTGLANLGNTCYLNAVVQVLRYCPGFLKSLVNLHEISTQNCPMSTDLTRETVSPSDEDLSFSKRPSIIHSVHKLTNKMETAEENYNKFGLEANEVKIRSGWTTLAVRPQNFVKDFSGLRPLFSGYQQHDAQEFLRSFLSLVEEECIGLVQGEQQEDVKGCVSITNNKSKVRGGCKYPSPITSSVAVGTGEEPAKMVVTDESFRVSPNIEVGLNSTGCSSSFQTTMLKSLQKVVSPENENVVKQLFEGTLLLQTCCLSCEGVRQRYENFQDISVPVQNTKSENSEKHGKNLSDSEDESDRDLNLSWAISKFASIERLNGDNKYFCDTCATLTEADISTYFEKLPQVLTIHLKRFQTSYGNQNLYTSSWVTKVTKSLHTPQQLSLKKWCSKTCSEKNTTYSLFGVVMHSGMSSCSGHYLSYVNVDVLQRQADGRGNVDSNGCSAPAQCEGAGKNEDAMQDDHSCIEAVDECYNIDVPRKTAGENCQDQSVKCGSCQSRATKSSSVNGAAKGDDVPCHCASTFGKNDILSMCDEETKSQSTVEDRNFACDRKSVDEENGDLCCEETLAMDLDDEDTCDYSERVKDSVEPTASYMRQGKDTDDTEKGMKSDTQLRQKTPLRTSKTNTTESDNDSESSSDEDEAVIPRSMDITRYFKPIPKKSCSNIKQVHTLDTSSGASNVKLNEKDSCSQTSVKNGLKPGGVQKSRGSAFSAFEKRSACTKPRSESSSKKYSCSQTTDSPDSDRGLQTSPEQCSAFESYGTSSPVQHGQSNSEELTGQSCCTHRAEDAKHSSELTLEMLLDMEPSDKQCASDEKQRSLRNCSNVQPTRNQSNTDSGNGDSLSEKCSNRSTNHVASQNTCEGSDTPSSTWLKFDDAEVQEISAKDMEGILSPSTSCYSTPYLLFYYRC